MQVDRKKVLEETSNNRSLCRGVTNFVHSLSRVIYNGGESYLACMRGDEVLSASKS